MQPFSKMPSVQTECGGGKLRNSCVAINPDPHTEDRGWK